MDVRGGGPADVQFQGHGKPRTTVARGKRRTTRATREAGEAERLADNERRSTAARHGCRSFTAGSMSNIFFFLTGTSLPRGPSLHAAPEAMGTLIVENPNPNPDADLCAHQCGSPPHDGYRVLRPTFCRIFR